MLICINPAFPPEINFVCLTDPAAGALRQRQGAALLHNRKGVFVVDDDPGMLRAMDRLLRRHGYDTVLFESAEAFENYSELRKALCLCILLDINLNNGRSGLDLRKHLKEAGHSVPVIYMTGNDSPAIHKAALESGCLAYLVKPLSARSLIVPLERAAGLRQPNV